MEDQARKPKLAARERRHLRFFIIATRALILSAVGGILFFIGHVVYVAVSDDDRSLIARDIIAISSLLLGIVFLQMIEIAARAKNARTYSDPDPGARDDIASSESALSISIDESAPLPVSAPPIYLNSPKTNEYTSEQREGAINYFDPPTLAEAENNPATDETVGENVEYFESS
jgi:hypothetical protein